MWTSRTGCRARRTLKSTTAGRPFTTINLTWVYLDFKVLEFKGKEFSLLVFGHHHKGADEDRGLILKPTGTKSGEYSRIWYFDTRWALSAGGRRKTDELFIWGDNSAVSEEGSYEKVLKPNESGLKQYVFILVWWKSLLHVIPTYNIQQMDDTAFGSLWKRGSWANLHTCFFTIYLENPWAIIFTTYEDGLVSFSN